MIVLCLVVLNFGDLKGLHESLELTPKRVNKSARRAVRRLAPREAAPEVGLP